MIHLLQLSPTTVQLIFGLIVAFMTGGGFVAWLNKKKTKAETQGIVADKFNALVERLETRIDKLQAQNDKCELEHAKTQLELEEMKEQMNYQPKLKGTVYILDDDYDDLHELKTEFRKISIIDYKSFHNHRQFIQEAKIRKPSIVVIDHKLADDGTTALDVIKELGYEPEKLIMSGLQSYEKLYEGMGVKFFVKEGDYIFQIVGEVIKFLSTKK